MNYTPLLFGIEDDGIHPIDYNTAMFYVKKYHYLHRACPCSAAFGLFRGGEVVGVVVYGQPASPPLCAGICGPDRAGDVIELCRLWVRDDQPKNSASHLIGRTLPKCGKPIVVSFADTSQGHVGVVYQATNWIYTGLSSKHSQWVVNGETPHGKSLANKTKIRDLKAVYGEKCHTVQRPRKHRYVYFNCNKRKRKELIALLRYTVLPYPKKELIT